MKMDLTLQDLDLLLQLLEIGIDKHQEEIINAPYSFSNHFYSHLYYHSEVIERYRELEKKIKTTKQEIVFK